MRNILRDFFASRDIVRMQTKSQEHAYRRPWELPCLSEMMTSHKDGGASL